MALISITITESDRQEIAGIPTSIQLSTNIPATIFYSLDGSDPDSTSLLYLGNDLELPLNQPSVTLKLLATNGVDSSPIITREFKPDIPSTTQSRARFTAQPTKSSTGFPYGKGYSYIPYDRSVTTGITVNAEDIQNVTDGYDGDGYLTGGTDLDISEYLIRYSESNRANTERGRGIGTLPSRSEIAQPEVPPVYSERNDKLFNPRALVIFQDSREEPFDPNIVNINRSMFDLANPEKVRDGILYNTTAYEGNVPSGSLVRTTFNPRENTLTYYYHDSHSLRWIISKEPYTPRSARTAGLQKIMFSPRGEGSRKVFKWIPFKGSRII